MIKMTGSGRGPAPQYTASRTAGALLLSFAFLAPGMARAQPHEVQRDSYTLRSSTVVSTALSPSTAREHGIDRSPSRAVLNAVVLAGPGGTQPTTAADLAATVRSLTGVERKVEMKPARAANGDISYVGTYEFAPREVLQFELRARPMGSTTELSMSYSERMPGH